MRLNELVVYYAMTIKRLYTYHYIATIFLIILKDAEDDNPTGIHLHIY